MSRTSTPATSQRPKPKRTPEAGERLLRALRAGMSFDQAARVGGISDVTQVDWRKDDLDFADACEKARCEMELTMACADRESRHQRSMASSGMEAGAHLPGALRAKIPTYYDGARTAAG
jgi:hypothetical protein